MMYYIFDDEEFKGGLTYAEGNKQYRRKWCDAEEVDPEYGDSELCPVCGGPISSRKWLEPRKMRLTAGKFPDRLHYWIMEPLVVSERFVKLYRESNLTGIDEFQPIDVVKVTGRHAAPPPRYYWAKVRRSSKLCLDPEKSIIEGRKLHRACCALCNPNPMIRNAIHKLVLKEDVNSEDMLYDIFQIYSLHSYVIVSQRFFEFVQKHQFTNFNLVPVEEYTEGVRAANR